MSIGVDASSSGSYLPLLFAGNIILREEAKSRGFPFVGYSRPRMQMLILILVN